MPDLPTLEFFTVIRWMVIVSLFVSFTTAVATWVGLIVKQRYWETHGNRRGDEGVLKIFAEQHKKFVEEIHEIKEILQDFKCKYIEKGEKDEKMVA